MQKSFQLLKCVVAALGVVTLGSVGAQTVQSN